MPLKNAGPAISKVNTLDVLSSSLGAWPGDGGRRDVGSTKRRSCGPRRAFLLGNGCKRSWFLRGGREANPHVSLIPTGLPGTPRSSNIKGRLPLNSLQVNHLVFLDPAIVFYLNNGKASRSPIDSRRHCHRPAGRQVPKRNAPSAHMAEMHGLWMHHSPGQRCA